MLSNYPTPPVDAPDPFDVARANRSAEFGWWHTATDGGADTAFARARRADEAEEIEWTAPRQVAS